MTPRRRPLLRSAGLLVSVAVLAVIVVLGIAVGAKQIPLDQVWHGVFHYSGSDTDVVIRDVRVPRTLLGLIVGAALGLVGTVMQALTRNPWRTPEFSESTPVPRPPSSPPSASSASLH